MPTVDEILGDPPDPSGRSVDDILGPPPAPTWGGRLASAWAATTQPVAHVLSAFGQGVREGWGTESLGLAPQTEQALRQAGIYEDLSKGQGGLLRAFNEAMIRPAAVGFDAALRGAGALFRGAQGAVAQTGAELGAPVLGQDIAAIPEAFFGQPGGIGMSAPSIGETVAGVRQAVGAAPAAALAARLAATPLEAAPPTAAAMVTAARDNRVIGYGEAGWKGTQEPAPFERESPYTLRAQVQDAQMEAPGLGTPSEEPPTDIHVAARLAAPETFQEYDALAEQRDTLRARIADSTAELRRQAEAQAPGAAEIAELERRMEDTSPRLAKKYQARLDELRPAHDAFMGDDFTLDALSRETPEIAALRQELLKLDYRMRDLAPDVTAAYRTAAERMPPAVEEAPPAPVEEITPPARETAAPEPPKPADEITPPAAEPIAAPSPEPAKPETPPSDIAGDVARHLVQAGRPADEAAAAGELLAAHYEARAARFNGTKGTAADLYRADGPTIRGGTRGGRGGAAAGKAVIKDGRTIITLFSKADASTFLHETGHQWLEEMLSDARDIRAPASLLADAKTVRDYLGVRAGAAISTAQHEQFARSFERYLMEGRAPSSALAKVFAQFKAWLSKIYQAVEKLRAPITDDIRDMFDRLVTKPDDAAAVMAPETAATAPVPKPPTPYVRVPKEPERLAAFIKRLGGVRDEGGDLRHTLGGAKYRPGLIHHRGMPMDEAALKAWEAGYFPELGEERPSINDLRNAIEEDIKHNPRYSEQDQEALQRHQAAAAQNEEITRLAGLHAIDPIGLTHAEFFDQVAAAETKAKAEEAIAAETASHETAFDDFADEAKAWAEDHGEPWQADEFYGINGPRTLAELEDEYRQAENSRPVEQGQDSGQQPVPAAGPAGHGEEGAGHGGGGAGLPGRGRSPVAAAAVARDAAAADAVGDFADAGRGDAAAGTGRPAANPAGPHERFSDADSGLIDKAGNIRLDNVNSTLDVEEVLKEFADRNGGFMEARRGVVSAAEIADFADAMGVEAKTINIEKLRKLSVDDGIPLASRILAARQMMVQSAVAVREAMARAVHGSDEDVLAYADAASRHLRIQETVSGVTAEWGRAGAAFRALEGGKDAAALTEFLKAQTGRTLFQMRREAQLGLALETPQQLSKFLKDSEKPGFIDKVLEYWINGLISGPATHTTYAVGNALLAVWKAAPETAVAGFIGAARRALGSTEETVRAGEVGAQLYGIMHGVQDGIRAGWEAVKSGATTRLPGEPVADFALQTGPRGAIGGPLGTVVRLPSRGVATIHSFFRAIGYSQAKAALAYRAAAEEGLTGDAFAARVGELRSNPPEAMMEAARDAATEQTLMGKGGDFSRWLAMLADKPILGVPLLKFIMPFVKIGSNIMSQGLLERSPLGILDPGIRANLLGRNGAIARDTQMARIAVGTAIGATAVSLAGQDFLTGGGPSDPREAALWRMTGRQPYSVRIGDTWYGVHRLGPLAMVLGVGGDIAELGHAMETKELDKVGSLLVTSITKGLLDETWMRGPAELIEALHDPDRNGPAWVRNFASSFVPFSVGMAQMARAADPFSREARSMMDAVRNKVPWLSQALLPRIDIWGQPIANKEALGLDGLSAIYETHVNNDPVNQALLRLGVFPAAVERKIRGVELTDGQHEDFARTAGRLAKMQLDMIVANPGFTALPDGLQAKLITETVGKAREAAASLIMMRNPGIVMQAVGNKEAAVSSSPAQLKGAPR